MKILPGEAAEYLVIWMPQSKPDDVRSCVCMAENKRFGKILNVLSYRIDVPYPGSSEKTFHQNICAGHRTKTSISLNHKFPACANVLFSQSTEFWGLCSSGGDVQKSDTAFDIESLTINLQNYCRITRLFMPLLGLWGKVNKWTLRVLMNNLDITCHDL